jgi:hypothetical protein
MKKSAEISHNLLQNLLQWSRSQTGRIDFKPSVLPIDTIVSQNIELLQPTLKEEYQLNIACAKIIFCR